MQCARASSTPLVYQQDVAILTQRCELLDINLGCADRVFTRSAHQYDNRVWTRLPAGRGDHAHADFELTPHSRMGILGDFEHTAPRRLRDAGQFARGKLNGAKGLRGKKWTSDTRGSRDAHELDRYHGRQWQKQQRSHGPP